SYVATAAVGLALAVLWVGTPAGALAVLAMLGFLTRDIGIFLLGRFLAGPKGDFAALAILAALYLVVPSLLWQAHISFLLLPLGRDTLLTVVAAWAQALALAWWIVRAISDRAPR
ncbi:MAG TPA: hypothetical protein VFA87_10010, partial [Rhizomicrobium sp.]|nr:hypothetical protein [Rhizomicrobium sp.]